MQTAEESAPDAPLGRFRDLLHAGHWRPVRRLRPALHGIRGIEYRTESMPCQLWRGRHEDELLVPLTTRGTGSTARATARATADQQRGRTMMRIQRGFIGSPFTFIVGTCLDQRQMRSARFVRSVRSVNRSSWPLILLLLFGAPCAHRIIVRLPATRA